MISGRLSLSPFDVLATYTPSYTQDIPAQCGAMGSTPDGRTFKFGLAGATGLQACRLCQGPAVSTGLQGIAVTSAAAVGATSVVCTITAGTAYTAGQFAGGYMIVTGSSSSSQMLIIKGNSAVTTAGTTITLNTEPVIGALTASDTVSLWANSGNGVIVSPTTQTGTIVGIPIVAITAAYYGWFQTAGTGLVMYGAAATIGCAIKPSASTAGYVTPCTLIADNLIGSNPYAASATTLGLIDLDILS